MLGPRVRVTYINGIRTAEPDCRQHAELISDLFATPCYALWNKTAGAWADLSQARPLTLEAKMLFVVPASSLEYQYVARPQIVPGELLVNGTCNSMPGWCARVNTATVTCLLAILA